jgi:hypothetical protein
MLPRRLSTVPTYLLPDISPTTGEVRLAATPKSLRQWRRLWADINDSVISPLVGEMSGRTEGGNVERWPFHVPRKDA